MMKKFPEIDVNVCKSEYCENFSLTGCDDYIIPSFKLGFRAIHCQRCDGNSVLINNDDIREMIYPYISLYRVKVEGRCPECFSDIVIRYGVTAKGTSRYQCKTCQCVYSPHRGNDYDTHKNKIIELLWEGKKINDILSTLKITPATFYRKLHQTEASLEVLLRSREKELTDTWGHSVQTNIFRQTCRVENNTGLKNELLGMISCCSKTGYVFLASLNWTDAPLSSESHYNAQNRETEPTDLGGDDILKGIYRKYESFNKRQSFGYFKYTDEICSKKVIEPVVMAHFHFTKLRFISPVSIRYHFLYFDLFVRGSCITVYGADIREGKCDVFYVASDERITDKQYIYKGSYKIGWWNNIWHEYSCPADGGLKYLCNLTNLKSDKPDEYLQLHPSLNYSEAFIDALQHFFPKEKVESLTPKVLASILSIFVKFYNYCYLSPGEEITPAQKIGLAKKKYDIETLIDGFIEGDI
ncbi:helix-turn-helix domain-containing protein [Serratia plymuthica]|uniref:transposase-like zinc-binding domain-containing protein n=1 Tax=Serratia plymuthica TaxID=82996 RepID=UPI001F5382A1|nr:helix-turn-helix domain-containing protein [Serratia plymuthica]UNK29887.1 helix-turn-helix domain-containing protein [Serratia plymuthica]